MIVLKKKKESSEFKNYLTQYLEGFWFKEHNPSIKELRNDLNIKNVQLLKKTLRNLRVGKVLDGSYDEEGIYRIYPFKSLTTKSYLYSNLFE